MTKTITINVDEKVAEQFRKTARMEYGNRKGSLGRAFTDAIKYFIERKNREPDTRLVELAERGFKLGRLKATNRAEWHDR